MLLPQHYFLKLENFIPNVINPNFIYIWLEAIDHVIIPYIQWNLSLVVLFLKRQLFMTHGKLLLKLEV